MTGEERDRFRIELISEEAMRTSAIEGEMLDRSSVQSSLRRQFGLTADGAPSKLREQGVAEMMVDVYSTYEAPLTDETLCRWHGMLLSHDRGLETIGAYLRETLTAIANGHPASCIDDLMPWAFQKPSS